MNHRPLTFVSGQSASNDNSIQCAELDILDDDILEKDETFSLNLSNQSDKVYITAGKHEAEVIIREDDTDCKWKWK